MKTETIDRDEIINRICYTDLVYGRINKKLKSKMSRLEIEKLMMDTLSETDGGSIHKKGKNYYFENIGAKIRVTVNSNTYRIITVDRIG